MGMKMQQRKEIHVAAAEFDRASVAERAAKAEAERQEVVERFPLDDWPAMPLETYAIGHDQADDAFCKWLEYLTPNIASIKGGSAFKLLIFKHARKPGWYFDSEYENKDEAWQAIRAGFVEVFQKAVSCLI